MEMKYLGFDSNYALPLVNSYSVQASSRRVRLRSIAVGYEVHGNECSKRRDGDEDCVDNFRDVLVLDADVDEAITVGEMLRVAN